MAQEVVVPELGEAGMEITFAGWCKEEGDVVAEGDDLFEVDTDKTVVTVQAFTSGILQDLRVQPGETVEHRQVVALICDPDEQAPAPGADEAATRDATS